MILIGILLLLVPFVLPIWSLVSMAGVRSRLRDVEETLERQQHLLDELTRRVGDLRKAAAPVTTPAAAEPAPEAPRPPVAVTPPPPPEPFDWERLIGVKMFSAVAGVALALAAVFFLRYSIDQGWLGPEVRVAIGLLTGIALLVVCEMKAARDYPTTANAMDASAIAMTPLVFERRPSEPGRSRFRIRLPAGRLPLFILHLDVGGGNILRPAKVFEARLAGTHPAARAGRSVYRVRYPVGGLPPARLVLSTTARVFNRQVAVVEERAADSIHRDPWIDTLASSSWVNANPDADAMPLTLPLPPPQADALLVVVDEGDNTPLPIEKARLLLPAYRLRLFRGANDTLRVAYGRTDLSQPQYDLALLAPQVLGTPATDVALGPEQPAGANPTAATIMPPRVFWSALAIAVIVLLTLIARLLRKEAASPR